MAATLRVPATRNNVRRMYQGLLKDDSEVMPPLARVQKIMDYAYKVPRTRPIRGGSSPKQLNADLAERLFEIDYSADLLSSRNTEAGEGKKLKEEPPNIDFQTLRQMAPQPMLQLIKSSQQSGS